MKVLVQRVKRASCVVNNQITGSIAQGLLLFISFNQSDTAKLIPLMAKKVANLRILDDDQGKMNLNIKTKHYPVLSISQFTLEADTKKGNRPSFINAMEPSQAEAFYHAFNQALIAEGIHVETGAFGDNMAIDLINDGPVTVMLEKTSN